MRRWFFAAIAATVVACVPLSAAEWEEVTEAEADRLTLTCGEIKNSVQAYQFGTGLWLEYIAQTRRPASGDCPWIQVGVSAYVVGVSGSAHSGWDMFTAEARKQVPVPNAGVWQVNSAHYRSWFGIFTFSNGTGATHVDVNPPEDPMQVTNDPSNPNIVSPVIVDSGRDGFHLTSVADGVLFDIDADGALDRVAWTQGGDGDDEFLAMDRNGNGRVDDGSELFGNHTPVYPQSDVTAGNGFDALAFMEGPEFGRSVIDRMIDARDVVFSRLLLWRDANHNGISEPGELRPLTDSGVIAIDTRYETARRRDRHGNEFRQRARAQWPDGEFFIYDVWLRRE